MATVDLDNIEELRKGCRCLYIAVESNVADDITRRAEALIRRVERLTEALKSVKSLVQCDCACSFHERDHTELCAISRATRETDEALKEEPDSVG